LGRSEPAQQSTDSMRALAVEGSYRIRKRVVAVTRSRVLASSRRRTSLRKSWTTSASDAIENASLIRRVHPRRCSLSPSVPRRREPARLGVVTRGAPTCRLRSARPWRRLTWRRRVGVGRHGLGPVVGIGVGGNSPRRDRSVALLSSSDCSGVRGRRRAIFLSRLNARAAGGALTLAGGPRPTPRPRGRSPHGEARRKRSGVFRAAAAASLPQALPQQLDTQPSGE